MADPLQVIGPRAGGAPLTYEVVAPGSFDLQTVYAHFDGSGASGEFRPTVTIKAQDGTVLSKTFPTDALAAGDVADITYTPFRRGSAETGPTFTEYQDFVMAQPTLWAYWPLNDASGDAVDIVGGRNLQPVEIGGGANHLTYGLPGPFIGNTSVGFTGTSGTANGAYFEGTVSGLSAILLANHTVMFWYKPNDADNGGMWSVEDAGILYREGRIAVTDSVQVRRRNSAGTILNVTKSGVPQQDQVWRHFCFTHDMGSGSTKLYIAGVEVASGSAVLTTAADVMHLGATLTGVSTYLTGRMAHAAIFSGLVTPATIAQLADPP